MRIWRVKSTRPRVWRRVTSRRMPRADYAQANLHTRSPAPPSANAVTSREEQRKNIFADSRPGSHAQETQAWPNYDGRTEHKVAGSQPRVFSIPAQETLGTLYSFASTHAGNYGRVKPMEETKSCQTVQ
ncbi:Protein of unknown function [Gryllus bimaculatus]|nr:Protein of unknown function [Gryllus bimaculatus]